MRKRIVIILMAAVMITGCGNVPHSSAELQSTAEEADIDAKSEDPRVSEESEAVLMPETIPESDAGNEPRANSKAEVRDEQAVSSGPEFGDEKEVSSGPESGDEQAVSSEPESGDEQEISSGPESGDKQEVSSGSESDKEQEVSPQAEAVPEEMPVHTCSLDGGSTVTVLAFGENEPNCFYGAKYDVRCKDCGECLDVVYREPLGHTGNEGVVTCQPDCSGEGSVRYTCIRCGAEWSEAYGQVQPHAWVEGIRKETDWINGGTKEVPYLYCSVCGIREESK